MSSGSSEADRLAQRRRGVRLHRDHAHARRERGEDGGDACQQPAASDGDEDRAEIGALLEDLERDGALTRRGAGVLVGVHEDGPRAALEVVRRLDRVVVALADLRISTGKRPSFWSFVSGAVRGRKSVAGIAPPRRSAAKATPSA